MPLHLFKVTQPLVLMHIGLHPKTKVTEATHLGALGKFIIEPLVTFTVLSVIGSRNSFISVAT